MCIQRRISRREDRERRFVGHSVGLQDGSAHLGPQARSVLRSRGVFLSEKGLWPRDRSIIRCASRTYADRTSEQPLLRLDTWSRGATAFCFLVAFPDGVSIAATAPFAAARVPRRSADRGARAPRH